MPRLPHLELPGVPLHATQRGINKGAIFLDADDRYHFRRLLRRAFRDHGIALHAFVLMDNHFYLLVTPDAIGRLSLAMGRVGVLRAGIQPSTQELRRVVARTLQVLPGAK